MPARDWDAGEERDEDEVWAVGSVDYGTPAGGSAGVASCRLSEASSAEVFRTSAK